MITGAQIRAARALIKLDQKQIASAADVSVETIKRLEKIDGPLLSATGNTVAKIQTALEASGIEFINTDRGDGVVKLRNDS